MDFSTYKLPKKKVEKGIHSYLHEVVREVCHYVGEPKKFGLWLGVGKKIGAGELKHKLEYIKERGIKNSHYLLKSCSKK